MKPFTALVLAASRPDDPVARACGTSHKALAPVNGVPMIARVVGALRASRSVGGLNVCIEARSLLAGLPLTAADIGFVAVAPTPSASVLSAAAELEFPLLVTTADHALLTPEMIDFFCDAARETGADLVAALAPASVILREHPGAVRTFLPFHEDRYSGCNLFALLTPRSLEVVRFWGKAERYRKQPWKVVGTFGIGSLILFALGRFTLESGMRRASRVLGAQVAAVKMPYAEAAIDVDKPADLQLAETILRARESVPHHGREIPSR